MASAPPSTSPPREGEDGHSEEPARGTDVSQPVMPEDGYEWKKYGQKYIRRIGKIRSYFRCRNRSCGVKKKVEWVPSDPSILRIVYDGVHDHPSRSALEQEASASSTANQYELASQVFGHSGDPSGV